MTIREYFTRKALTRASGKPAPDRIPMSRPAIFDRDYFVVYLQVQPGPQELLLTGVTDAEVLCAAFDPETERLSRPVSISWDLALDGRISLTSYYRQAEFSTDNPVRFVLEQWLRLPLLTVLLDRVLQWGFNRWPLKRHTRMSMLRLLVERTDGRKRGPENELTLTAFRTRALFHPGLQRIRRRNRQLLDALVAEGLAEQKDSAYRSTGLAIGALEKDRRDRRAQRWKWFAGAIAAVWAVLGFIVPNWSTIHGWLPGVGGTVSAPTTNAPSSTVREPR
ncbi:hypothetical protein [Burkholderia cenocepacia]|uniref:hypothetical protein n=1 Tax=Burkholderia cenocepacia TaxID=95486 RepID=UPI002232A389|nr:hypothetical protein [Burkholderia cenocepacia]MCW3677866.1 hypothetical protein [Burkholderia cenocepacia]